jgi:hypothetical protein
LHTQPKPKNIITTFFLTGNSGTLLCIFIDFSQCTEWYLQRKKKSRKKELYKSKQLKGNIITTSYLLYFIVIYFTVLHIIFYFYLHSHLVLDNHSVEVGTQERGNVLQVTRRRTTRAFATVSREFDINPEFPRGKILLLLQHSALGVPTWHTCLVSLGCGENFGWALIIVGLLRFPLG